MGQAKRRGTFEERKNKAIQRDNVLDETYFKERNDAIRRIASRRNVAVVDMSPRLSLADLLLAVSHNPHRF